MPNAKIVAPASPWKQARDQITQVRNNAATATDIRALRDEVTRAADVLEVILDRLEGML